MPHFLFTCPPESVIPGCVERVCLYAPWDKPMQALNQGGQPMFDQGGRPVIVNPDQAAWNWLVAQGLVWPEGVQLKIVCLNPSGKGAKPTIYCIQKTEVAVDRTQVNAPYATPMGNGRGLTMPPQPTPKGQGGQWHGQYEEIDGSGLANTSDPLMGDADATAGTWTDVSPTSGEEVVRQMAMPPSKKVGY